MNVIDHEFMGSEEILEPSRNAMKDFLAHIFQILQQKQPNGSIVGIKQLFQGPYPYRGNSHIDGTVKSNSEHVKKLLKVSFSTFFFSWNKPLEVHTKDWSRQKGFVPCLAML